MYPAPSTALSYNGHHDTGLSQVYTGVLESTIKYMDLSMAYPSSDYSQITYSHLLICVFSTLEPWKVRNERPHATFDCLLDL